MIISTPAPTIKTEKTIFNIFCNMRLKTPRTRKNTKQLILFWYLFGLCFLSSSSSSSNNFAHLMANAEFYSSVDSLGRLGNIEATLLEKFRNYLKEQQEAIDSVHRFIENIKFHHKLASEDINDYIENPINAFTLIKRMVNDWTELNEFLKFNKIQNDWNESLTQIQGNNSQPLDEYELKGAIRGLKRLQDTYVIKADEMANGYKYGKQLDWRDCLEIGATLLDDRDFELSVDWLEISLRKLKETQKETAAIKNTFSAHIKDYLAWAYRNTGKSEKALNYLDEVLESDSENPAKFTNKLIFGMQMLDVRGDLESPEYTEDEINYKRLCRGENLKKNLNLNCILDTKIHPFFILSPLQVEPINSEPSILLYHNILNDAQIDRLYNSTDNRMFRSEVKIENSNRIAEVRVSQQVGVHPAKSEVANIMYKLVGIISGLDMANTEMMQVANYGIGGQFELHYDFFGRDYDMRTYSGDRISTSMFYLSNVAEGGYTVFPTADVYLEPVKGAMVMWYNLYKSLNEDYRTLHGGCPVLRGTKRIANIWTHSGSQEFRRPCALENDSKKK